MVKMRHMVRLGDGQEWEFSAAEGARDWAERLASILGIQESSSHQGSDNLICNIMEEGGNPDLDIIRMWQALSPLSRRTWELGGLSLHAALIERNGRGYILAGHGGAGKSTCCRRIPSEWNVLCDDEILVVLDSKGRYLAHPLPTWSNYLTSGKNDALISCKLERCVPIEGIFFLEQAKTDKVIRIGKGNASAFIAESALQAAQRNFDANCKNDNVLYRRKIFENSCAFAKKIPAFVLHVSLSGKFWEKIEDASGQDQ
jgi:SynChlorMet cassette protein ScmC